MILCNYKNIVKERTVMNKSTYLWIALNNNMTYKNGDNAIAMSKFNKSIFVNELNICSGFIHNE